MPSRLSDLERFSAPPPHLEQRAGRRRLLGNGMTAVTAASALIALL